MLKKVLMFASLLTFFLSLAAIAQEHIIKIDDQSPEKKIIKIEKNLPMLHLNLTDEQKKAFKKIELNLQKEILPLRNELDVKQLELDAEKTEDQPDLKKINPLVDDVYKLQATIEKKSIAADLQKRSLLDADQRKLWNTDGPFGGRKFHTLMNQFGNDRLMWLGDDLPKNLGERFGEDHQENIEREIEIR